MTDEWTMRWEGAEAQWSINRAIIISLPDLAVEAMQAGWDSPSLRVLAGMSMHDDARDLRDTFLSAVRELGRELPGQNDAAERLMRLYSLAIVHEEIRPYDGARLIARLGYDFCGETQDQVMAFVSLEDEHSGGWGRTPEEIDANIIQEAHAVVDGR